MSVALYQASNLGLSYYLGNSGNQTFATVCFATWVVCFAFFLAHINPTHRHSFFDMQTGKQFTLKKFENRGNVPEEETIDLFTITDSHWSHIRPELQEWLSKNWKRWEIRRPKWFNEEFLNLMWLNHRDLLPEYVLDVLEAAELEIEQEAAAAELK